jgi:hypothetical protein
MRSQCLDTMTKAVNMQDKMQGDDLILNRLFALLNKRLPFIVNGIKQIRNNVYFVESEIRPFILKGYSSLENLRLQETFTASLKSTGFNLTYSFYPLVDQPVFFNQQYFGLIEFIDGHPQPFTYSTQANRINGLNTLQAYHNKTKTLVKQFRSILSRFNLEIKWHERVRIFQTNLPFIQYYLKEPIIRETLTWAHESLAGIHTEKRSFFEEESVILHGDVAHHNFLKAKNEELYLIDFDLISIGGASADLLQYANRILPAINWSLPKLFEYPHLQSKLQDPAFLWALMYPTDILREWNRIIKDKSYLQPSKLLMVMDITIPQFHLRQQFNKDLKNMLK